MELVEHELTVEYTRLQRAIAALQRERSDIAIQITKERQQRQFFLERRALSESQPESDGLTESEPPD